MDLKLKLNLNNLNVENLPPAKKYLLLAVPPVLIIAITVMLFIKPAIAEKKRLNGEIEKQNSELATLKRNTAKLPMLIAENKRLTSRLQELQLQLPEEREVSGLLKQVSELGVKSGLQIALWRPKGKVVHASNEIYEIPVEVSMRGPYHKVGEFYSNVTRLNRIVNIGNIALQLSGRPSRALATLSVGFTAMTYSLIPEAEKKAMMEAAKKKK